MYCHDCERPVCEKCFIRDHNGHGNSGVDESAAQLRKQLSQDVEEMDLVSSTDMATLRELEEQRATLLANAQVE